MSDLRYAADATVPSRSAPSGALLPQDVALAFRREGLAALHASLLDAESMICESSWAITKDGSVQDSERDLDFSPAMVTIVRLNPLGARQTVTRQLAPQRWAFGWRVDEHRVIVAEARYRAAHEAPSDADVALVRRLCDVRVRSVGQTDALNDEVVTLPEAANDQVLHPAAEGRQAEERRPAGGGATPASSTSRSGRRWMLPGLCLLALAAGGVGYVQWHRSEALASEAQRLRALSEATLVQGIAAALDRGDYGELQSELDRFERLRYFDAAVVANARGQVVSKSDTARGVRIGEVLKPESVAGSRSIDLPDGSAQGLGRLYIWPHRSAP